MNNKIDREPLQCARFLISEDLKKNEEAGGELGKLHKRAWSAVLKLIDKELDKKTEAD